MRNPRLILLLVFAVLITSCDLPLSISPVPTPTQASPNSTMTPALPPTPVSTPFPTFSPTPASSQLTPKSKVINCRAGPDVAYPSLDTIDFGQTALIAGKDKDGKWWYVRDPNDTEQFCWVSAGVTTTSGNLDNLPVIPNWP